MFIESSLLCRVKGICQPNFQNSVGYMFGARLPNIVYSLNGSTGVIPLAKVVTVFAISLTDHLGPFSNHQLQRRIAYGGGESSIGMCKTHPNHTNPAVFGL